MSTDLMLYLDDQAQEMPQGGARKYIGPVAQGYDQKREESDKWKIEQEIIEGMLDDLPSGSWVLDVPCGTGRFFQFYHDKGFVFRAVDMSADMLRIAAGKVIDPMKARLQQGDVRALPLNDKCVDASVACRITRWLSPDECQLMIRELQRVTRQKIIFTARVANHPHARPLELFIPALDGWNISKNAQGYHPDYRIIELRPE